MAKHRDCLFSTDGTYEVYSAHKSCISISCHYNYMFCIFGELPVYVTARLYAFGYMIGGLFSIYIMRRKTKMNMKVVIHKALFWQLTPFIISGFNNEYATISAYLA